MKTNIAKIAFITVFAMFINCMPIKIVNAEEQNINTEIKIICDLGIVDSIPDKDAIVTRAAFASAVSRIINNGKNISNTSIKNVVQDVSEDNPSYGDIIAVKQLGIMSGFEGNMFLPEQPITYEQVAASIVKLLNRQPYAQINGGYPYGYITVANNLNLFSGLSLKIHNSINYNDLAVILINALDTPILTVDTVSNDNLGLIEEKDITLGYHYMKLIKEEGIVYANELTSLYDANGGCSENEIFLNNTYLYSESLDLIDTIGKEVSLYYKVSDENLKNIILSITETKRNQVETIIANDIDKSNKDIIYKIINNEKTSKYSLDEDIRVIYNGKALDMDLTNDYLNINDGFIKLIDNDKDNIYEVMLIEELTTILFAGIDTERYIIYSKNNDAPITYDADDTLRVISNEEFKDVNSIPEGSIAMVGKSGNAFGNKHLNIYVSTNSIISAVSEIQENYITTSDKEYNISPYFLYHYRNEKIFGEENEFLMDYLGRISALKTKKTNLSYGFLYKYGFENAGLNDTLKLKLIDSNGNRNVYKVNEKVKIDGNIIKNASEVLTILESSAILVSETGIRQVIKYKLNNNADEIIEIDTVIEDKSGNNEGSLKVASDICQVTSKYYSDYRTFNQMCVILPVSSIIFYAPKGINEEDYGILTSINEEGKAIDFTITAYDVNDVNIAGVIAINSEYSVPVSVYSSPILVEKIYSGLNSEGISAILLKGYSLSNKNGIVLELGGDMDFNTFSPGDFVRFKYDAKGRPIEYSLIFSPQRDGMTTSEVSLKGNQVIGAYNASYRVVLGQVYALDATNLQISVLKERVTDYHNVSARLREPAYMQRATVYVCNFSKSNAVKIEVLTPANSTSLIKDAKSWGDSSSIALMRFRSVGAPYDIVIYNNLDY